MALRAGNEKDEDQADTVGCCSLRVEHLSLHEEKNGKEYVVVFDFLGKDSIRYYNEVSVEKRVFKNLQLFKENKEPGNDLFDRLNVSIYILMYFTWVLCTECIVNHFATPPFYTNMYTHAETILYFSFVFRNWYPCGVCD